MIFIDKSSRCKGNIIKELERLKLLDIIEWNMTAKMLACPIHEDSHCYKFLSALMYQLQEKPAKHENITRCLSATVVYWVLIELINLFVFVSTHRPKSFHNIKTISASIGKLLRKDYSVWILYIFVTSYTGKRVYQVPPGKYDSDHVPRATCSRCPFTHEIVITCMLTMLVIVCCSTYRNNFLVITCDSNGFHTCM